MWCITRSRRHGEKNPDYEVCTHTKAPVQLSSALTILMHLISWLFSLSWYFLIFSFFFFATLSSFTQNLPERCVESVVTFPFWPPRPDIIPISAASFFCPPDSLRELFQRVQKAEHTVYYPFHQTVTFSDTSYPSISPSLSAVVPKNLPHHSLSLALCPQDVQAK